MRISFFSLGEESDQGEGCREIRGRGAGTGIYEDRGQVQRGIRVSLPEARTLRLC
jgi:hypothetical protein